MHFMVHACQTGNWSPIPRAPSQTSACSAWSQLRASDPRAVSELLPQLAQSCSVFFNSWWIVMLSRSCTNSSLIGITQRPECHNGVWTWVLQVMNQACYTIRHHVTQDHDNDKVIPHNDDQAAGRLHLLCSFTHLGLWQKLYDCSLHHFTTSQCSLK